MLYIGERVGFGAKQPTQRLVDIAVDPLEGTNLCATGAANAIAVLAAAERGGLLHAPIFTWTRSSSALRSEAPSTLTPRQGNLNAIAARLRRKVEDLTVIVLDRPRHRKLIQDIRDAGARIRLITDGDLSAGISAAVAGSGVHALMGIGGGPEGVIAAAMKCLNGEIQSRFVLKEHLEQAEDRAKIADGLVERMREMGISDPTRVYHTNDLAPGDKIIFAACGVTDGTILRGVRFFGTGKRTQSLVMTTETMHVRFVDTMHVEGGPDAFVRFDRM